MTAAGTCQRRRATSILAVAASSRATAAIAVTTLKPLSGQEDVHYKFKSMKKTKATSRKEPKPRSLSLLSLRTRRGRSKRRDADIAANCR